MTKRPELIKRTLSAAVIAPLFLYSIISGEIILKIWLFIAFILSLYEWHGMARKLNFYLPVMLWGAIYMSLSYSSFLAIREVYSIELLLMFLGMIWFSDIGAYFVGRFYGGPKLAGKISPNKTWSGFGGALAFPMIFALLWYWYADLDGTISSKNFSDYTGFFVAAVIGAVVGCVGQAGDLLVSYIKRMAKIKDTGNIIPGHGGLLDRIDSMLLGAPVFLTLITLLSYVL